MCVCACVYACVYTPRARSPTGLPLYDPKYVLRLATERGKRRAEVKLLCELGERRTHTHTHTHTKPERACLDTDGVAPYSDTSAAQIGIRDVCVCVCACVCVTVGMYEDAVARALRVDLSLAQSAASAPPEEETGLRHRLWLSVAKHVVQVCVSVCCVCVCVCQSARVEYSTSLRSRSYCSTYGVRIQERTCSFHMCVCVCVVCVCVCHMTHLQQGIRCQAVHHDYVRSHVTSIPCACACVCVYVRPRAG